MDLSLAIGIACVVASLLGIAFVGWKSDGKSLRAQFEDLPKAAAPADDIARRTQA